MPMHGRTPGPLPAGMFALLLLTGSAAGQTVPEPSTLRATINQGRISAGQSVLTPDAALDEAAQLAAQEGSTAAQVQAFLAERRYVTLQIELLNGTGNASALAVALSWQTDPAARRALEDADVEEIGTAAAANPAAKGANDAFRWVAILAKPRRASKGS